MKKYPEDYTSSEIEKEIEKDNARVEQKAHMPGVTSVILERIRDGKSELTWRKTKKLNHLIILISAATLIGTLVFSVLDFVGDTKWQEEQLDTLLKIESLLEGKEGLRQN